MFKIVVLNLGFLAAVAIPIFVPELVSKFADSVALRVMLTALGILFCCVYLAAVAISIKPIADYKTFAFSDVLANFKTAIPAGLVMGFFIFIVYIVVVIIIPFYLSIESVFGLGLAAFIFWAAIFALLAFQFYFTIYARLNQNVFKAFRKCMIVFLDNSGFSIFLFFHNLVVFLISLIFIFLFPGPVGVLLYLDEALRLRLLKYDWLEANPGANRRKIPWDVLLIEEREKTGIRNLRNFIFPWKD